jgi:hypothetical protein
MTIEQHLRLQAFKFHQVIRNLIVRTRLKPGRYVG